MGSNELFDAIKSISKRLKDILNPIQESTIIFEFYISLLEDLVYRNILENFFNNLTDENIKDCDLLPSDIEIIKKDFKKIQNDIKISAEDIDEVIFTKSYYSSSKRDILAKYPALEKIFNEIEEIVVLDSIEEYIKNQKLEYVEDCHDYRIILNTLILENLIKNKHFKEISQLNQEDLSELIDMDELSDKLLEKSMQITKWEIWKTYSTYTNRTFNYSELKEISEILVKNNLVTSILMSDCSIIWKDGKKVKEDQIFDFNYSQILALLNKLPGYAAEGIHQFYLMWKSEERILKDLHYDFPYIKCFLSPIMVTFTPDHTKILYPQLTIYDTGILNLTFRIISPDKYNYEINNFIYNEINSNNLKIKEVKFPYEILENLKYLEIDELEKNKETIKLEPFEHDFVKLYDFENLLDFTQFLIQVISFQISKKFRKIDYYNNYWLYSQSIYLLDYKNQPYHKEEIIDNFREYLIQIMYRLPFLFDVNFSKELPKDLREINQYCLFIIKGMSLWVSSKDELEKFKDDINNQSKVYEKQVLVEAINHFNLLANKLYEISYHNGNYDEAIKLQKELINFQRLFKTTYVSNFGEINHILNYCYEELEWGELITLSNELLDIEKNHQNNRRSDNIQYSVILLAIVTLCSQLLLYYSIFKDEILFIGGILFLFFLSLILKEKIYYVWQILKLVPKFIYNLIVLLLKRIKDL
ncbi:hypothetical protein [Methanobrevibacter sp.]|uniref:hypothetical protein n=1 Tax=Methanobrevibacter sp. TaxID=66852 RepID=UPI003864907E